MQNPAQTLILEYLHPKDDALILALEGGVGWLAGEVARFVPAGEVLSLTRDVRDVWIAQEQLKSIPNANTNFDVFPKFKGWDIVVLTIPKERRYTRTLLIAAWEALKSGGQLLLAGPSKGGAKAVIRDAERLFGNATVLGYRNHQRVAACVKVKAFPNPLPKEFQQAGVAPDTKFFVDFQQRERNFKLETHPGIFSWGALDKGTALLMENLNIETGARVWDVGCGYGTVGISAAFAGAEFVAMSDVNLIAVDYTKRNVINYGFDDCIKVFAADSLSANPHDQIGPPFDLIVSNPAFHQGRKVNKSMADSLIIQAPKWLKPNGRLIIVANRFLNYDKFMRLHFKHVLRIAETNRFHVIEAQNG